MITWRKDAPEQRLGDFVSAEECLAFSGSDTGVAWAIGGSAILLILIGALLIRGRVGTSLGALALIGALVLVPMATPSPAVAAADACAPPTATTDTEFATPAAPVSTPQCGAPPEVSIPASEQFDYTSEQAGETITVTAMLKPGLENVEVDPAATTVWSFDASFTPVTVLTSEDLAFDFMGSLQLDSTPDLELSDAAIADYLVSVGATLSVTTRVDWNVTWQYSDDSGTTDTRRFITPLISEFSGAASAEVSTIIELTQTGGSTSFDPDLLEQAGPIYGELTGIGYPFPDNGSLAFEHAPLDTVVGYVTLTATYTDECGESRTASATVERDMTAQLRNLVG